MLWVRSALPSTSAPCVRSARSRYVLPTDGLWHGAIYYLEPSSFIGQRLGSAGEGGNPFFAVNAPSWQYLLWTGVWFLLVLTAGLVSFDRREL